VLLDEVEKAHADVFNILLQVRRQRAADAGSGSCRAESDTLPCACMDVDDVG